MQTSGLSPISRQVVRTLLEYGPLDVPHLAVIAGIPAHRVRRRVVTLAKHGYVERLTPRGLVRARDPAPGGPLLPAGPSTPPRAAAPRRPAPAPAPRRPAAPGLAERVLAELERIAAAAEATRRRQIAAHEQTLARAETERMRQLRAAEKRRRKPAPARPEREPEGPDVGPAGVLPSW